MTAPAPDIIARLDRIEAMLAELVAARRVEEANHVSEMLRGMTRDEMRAWNRERNRRLKEQRQRKEGRA